MSKNIPGINEFFGLAKKTIGLLAEASLHATGNQEDCHSCRSQGSARGVMNMKKNI